MNSTGARNYSTAEVETKSEINAPAVTVDPGNEHNEDE